MIEMTVRRIKPIKDITKKDKQLFTLSKDKKNSLGRGKKGNAGNIIKELFRDKDINLSGKAKIGKIDDKSWEIIDDHDPKVVPRRFIIEEDGENLKVIEEVKITRKNKHEYFEKIIWECDFPGCKFKIEQKPNSTNAELEEKTIRLATFHMLEHRMVQ